MGCIAFLFFSSQEGLGRTDATPQLVPFSFCSQVSIYEVDKRDCRKFCTTGIDGAMTIWDFKVGMVPGPPVSSGLIALLLKGSIWPGRLPPRLHPLALVSTDRDFSRYPPGIVAGAKSYFEGAPPPPFFLHSRCSGQRVRLGGLSSLGAL